MKTINSALTTMLIIAFIGPLSTLRAQEEDAPEVYRSSVKLEYTKKFDQSKVIKANLSARIDRKPVPIPGAELSLYDNTDSSVFIQSLITDAGGIAMFTLPPDFRIGRDSIKSVLSISYKGADQYKPASSELEIKDAGMKASYEVIDSVNTVTVTAYEMINGEVGEPLTDMDVYVYVKRMFSLLRVGEGWLQDGEAIIEVPDNIPGDENNMLQLVTKIPESEEYGTIENESEVTWGAVDHHENKAAGEKRRALWKPMAPLWMVVTLSILIIGVFSHYLLIIYKLFKISVIGKKEGA